MKITTCLWTLLLPALSSSMTFDCKKIKADSVTWNLEKLGGLHQVSWIRPHADMVYNTTFKIDICKALKLEDKDEKTHCGDGTRICGIETHFVGDKKAEYAGAWPITRSYVHDGVHINPKFTRMKTEKDSDEEDGEAKEGLIAVLGGGLLDGKEQQTRINFVCSTDEEKERRAALAGDDEDEDEDEKDDDEDGDKQKKKWKEAASIEDGVGGRIEFVSYDEKELILNWTTPFGCEKAASDPEKEPVSDGGRSGGWGFFSWFFFIIFMLLLCFVAFTAWINYTRNGARGWDLLPFSDTLRDLPYILGDWSRKIAGTLGGGGTRGGYSAV